jgi:hypothetical protein
VTERTQVANWKRTECLHCGKRLIFSLRLLGADFCSEECGAEGIRKAPYGYREVDISSDDQAVRQEDADCE